MIVRAVNFIGIYDYLVSELLSILVDDCYYYGVGQPRLIVGGTGVVEKVSLALTHTQTHTHKRQDDSFKFLLPKLPAMIYMVHCELK